MLQSGLDQVNIPYTVPVRVFPTGSLTVPFDKIDCHEGFQKAFVVAVKSYIYKPN